MRIRGTSIYHVPQGTSTIPNKNNKITPKIKLKNSQCAGRRPLAPNI
jgi:hypothetical protein